MNEPKHHIDPKAIQVWRIVGSFYTFLSLVASLALTVLAWKDWIPNVVPIIGWIITLIEGIVMIHFVPVLRWKRCKYEVREEEIDIQKGWLIIKRTIVPMVRVQHVDTSHGPLLRSFKLASVHISTAATVHEIPALPAADASNIRDQIANLARVRDDDV